MSSIFNVSEPTKGKLSRVTVGAVDATTRRARESRRHPRFCGVGPSKCALVGGPKTAWKGVEAKSITKLVRPASVVNVSEDIGPGKEARHV